MTTTKIQIPQSLIEQKARMGQKIYLSDIISEFPSNCVFLKGATGIGGTTLAMRDAVPTIVAMPYRNGVINKSEAEPSVFGVYGSRGVYEDLEIYFCECDAERQCPKIVATYDAIPNILKIMAKLGCSTKGWRLVVDEMHIVFNDYKLRKKAARGLLNAAKQFDNVVYMTATPIEREFFFDQIKDMDIVEIEYPWKSHINILQVAQVRAETTKIVLDFLQGRRYGNAHIFVNNVSFISDIIEAAGLSEANTRVLCADLKRNAEKLHGIPVSNANTEVKKINFYTKTAFESCDIFDRNGQIFIVSDGSTATTMYDISTSYIQIIGRIRDIATPYVTHIYKETKYNGLTAEEFQAMTERNKDIAQKLIDMVNSKPYDERKDLIQGMREDYLNERYVSIDEDEYTLSFDKELLNGEIVNYKIVNGVYQSLQNVSAELIRLGYSVSVEYGSLSDEIKKNPSKRTTFEELYMEYSSLQKSDLGIGSVLERIADLEERAPLLKPCYFELGDDAMQELGYVKRDAKAMLIKKSLRSRATKIIDTLGYSNAQKITVEQKNRDIQRVEKLLGVSGIKLSDYYETKPTKIRKGKDLVSAIQIIRRKVIAAVQ